MCDQTEDCYGDGDVVWVKFGPVWWPGVVKDVEKEGKAEEVFGGLRNKPIAAVQFFDEDKYEFVKNLEHVYHFNCKRKEEFIKKGLDKCRAGVKHMSKFPVDVVKAEELVGGDKNILNDPKFAQEKKTDYKDLFSPVKSKKVKKGDDVPLKTLSLKTKFLPTKKRKSAPVSRASTSTASASRPTAGQFQCPFCDFSSNLIGATTAHVKFAHSSQRVDYGPVNGTPPRQRLPVTPRQVKSASIGRKNVRNKAPKGEKTPKKNGDAQKLNVASAQTSSSVSKPSPTLLGPEKADKKKRFTDALLADWSEDDDDESALTALPEISSSPPVKIPSEIDKKVEEDTIIAASNNNMPTDNDELSKPSTSATGKRETVSCFDFDEEDDGFIGMSNANTYGRKIPRVIPLKDKTDLGMDLEIEELFKRKPGSQGTATKKKRRGRPKSGNAPSKKVRMEDTEGTEKISKKPVEPPRETLASTRTRRPAARKSYVNEIITSIDETTFHKDNEKFDHVASPKVEKKRGRRVKSESDDDSTSKSAKGESCHELDNNVRKIRKNSAIEDSIEELCKKTSSDADVPPISGGSVESIDENTIVTFNNVKKKHEIEENLEENDVEEEQGSSTGEVVDERSHKTNDILQRMEEMISSKVDDNLLEQVVKEESEKVADDLISKLEKELTQGDDDEEQCSYAKTTPLLETKTSDESCNQSQDSSALEVQKILDETEGVGAPKPSRRKQDLKRSSLVELDDLHLPVTPKKIAMPSEDIVKTKPVRPKKRTSLSLDNPDDIEAQVESLLAETAAPVLPDPIPAAHQPATSLPQTDEEFMASTVEYLEEEQPAPQIVRLPQVKTLPALSPRKWKEDIRLALGTENLVLKKSTSLSAEITLKKALPLAPPTPPPPADLTVVKSLPPDTLVKKSLPHWKQVIHEALNPEKDVSIPAKEVIAERKVSPQELTTSNVVKITNPTGSIAPHSKSGTYYIVKQQSRPKILGKQTGQQVMIVSSQKNATQKVQLLTSKAGVATTVTGLKILTSKANVASVVTSAAQQSTISSPQVVKVIQEGPGGVKTMVPKKIIRINPKNATQNIVMSGKAPEGCHVIENYQGTGKTVILREVGNPAQVLGLKKKIINSSLEASSPPLIIQRGKGPDKKFTIQTAVKKTSGAQYIVPQQRSQFFAKRIEFDGQVPVPVPMTGPVAVEEELQQSPQPQCGLSLPLSLPEETSAPVEAPVEMAMAAAPIVAPSQQVFFMPVEGQNTFMVMTVDESGNVQHVPVDSSVVASYNLQTDGAGEMYSSSSQAPASSGEDILSEALPTVYPSSSGQDILAKALANTNLESEMSMLMSPVVQAISSLPLPHLTSLEMPALQDNQGLAPVSVVQETSALKKPIMTAVEVPSCVVPDAADLEPPPLPPTPDDDVLMEEEGGLMIAEPPPSELSPQQEESETAEPEAVQEQPDASQDNYFAEDSQEGEEGNTFQSMPLLNEESTASEEPIGDQNFHTQVQIVNQENRTCEFLPSSTSPDLEPEEGEMLETVADDKDAQLPYVIDDDFIVDSTVRSQETEVTSTTGDVKDSTA